METRVAVCSAPGQVGLARQELETLGPKDVLVLVTYCGVCPSDLRIFLGKSSSVHYPIQLGHEVSGVVAEVGSEVTSVLPGDRVVVDVIRRCGRCLPCIRGFENHCEELDWTRGGFADAIVAPDCNVYVLRDSTSLMDAAVTEPLACVIRGQKHVHPCPKDIALVIGAGPLGLMHLQLLKHFGATVIVSDLIENRLDIACRLGADATVNPASEDLAEAVADKTQGFGVDLAIVANSHMDAICEALGLMGFGGRLLVFGGIYPNAELTLDANGIHYDELQIVGTSDYLVADFAEALQFIEDGIVRVDPLISDVFPLTAIREALRAVQERGGLKIMVRCNDVDSNERRDP